MFGTNYFGQPYFGQGYSSINNLLIRLLRATTRGLAGFMRTTRRDY